MSTLAPEWRVGSVVLTDAPFLVPFGGVDYGAPENVVQLIASVLLDGDHEESTRTGNRTVVLSVLIEDADMFALSAAEALLSAECDKALNEVYVDPGDGFGEPFIFDVFRGQLAFSRNDDYEMAGYRSYSLTFRALPFPRSVTDETVTPTPTTIGTARQQMHSFAVKGTQRTEMAFSVQHPSTALNDAIVYSCPDDGRSYSPPLRQYARSATNAAATTDSALVSGKRNMLDAAAEFDAPASTYYEGRHLMVAKVRASGAGSAKLRVRAEVYVGGNSLYDVRIGQYDETLSEILVPLTFAGTAWRTVLMGDIALPLVDVGNPAVATIRFSFVDVDTSGIDVDLDEAWLFNVDAGALTWVDCGDNAPGVGSKGSPRLFSEPATVAVPHARLLTGYSADMSDAFFANMTLTDAIKSWDTHALPGGEAVKVLTVTTKPTSAVFSAHYPKRWHTHGGV